MNQAGRVLIFADTTGTDPVIVEVLSRARLTPMWPWDLSDESVLVSLVLIDRPSQSASKISANLRSQDRFRAVPILVLLDAADAQAITNQSGNLLARFSMRQVDVITKPVKPAALQRYIESKVAGRDAAQSSGELSSLAGEAAIHGAERRSGEGLADAVPRSVAGGSPEFEPGQVATQLQGRPGLEDRIPASDRLLTPLVERAPLSKGGVLCSHCRAWECKREDAFCSRCGEALVVVAMPGSAVNFEPLGDHRVGTLIEFANTGLNPAEISFSVLADRDLKRRFSLHAQDATLNPSSAEHLQVVFDARGLDRSARHRAELEVATNENGITRRRVELIVERLAMPRVVAQTSYPYVIGAENRWEFGLANDGGGTLSLSQVTLDEVVLELDGPLAIKGGQLLASRAAIPSLEIAAGRTSKKLRFEFEHYAPVVIEVEVTAVRPARLTTHPAELDFGVVSTGRAKRLALTLVNGGGENLIVESLASQLEWIGFPSKTPIRIPPGASSVIDVQVQGSREVAGEHIGEITIHSNAHNSPAHSVPITGSFVDPSPYEEYIGIDFGTTASCVAVLDEHYKPIVIELDRVEQDPSGDPRIMPSVLYFQEDGEVVAGREAVNQAAIQPSNAVTSIKRALGIQHKRVLAGREYDATDLASKVIEQLVHRTENGLFSFDHYKSPRRAVVTVPVEFFINQRSALLDACKLAGLEMESRSTRRVVIDEAHAAALYYLHKRVAETGELAPERLMIFDFGGGTLDCALIEIGTLDGKILLTTQATGGDPRLGGDDIDWALVEMLGQWAKNLYPDFDADCLGDEKKFKHKFRTAELAQAAHLTRARFKQQAEAAKISLSVAAAVDLVIEPLLRCNPTPFEPYILAGGIPARMEVTVARQKLEAVLAPLMKRAVAAVEAVCYRASKTPESVDTILHVGRTSKNSTIRETVNAFFPNAEDRSDLVEPKLCVALGAALWGYIKDKPSANVEMVGEVNRLTHDIGYFDVKAMQHVFVSVFPAQTEFPCEKTIELPNNQEWIDLKLAENRSMSLHVNGNCALIGGVRIDARQLPARTVSVRFAIDENRMLEITANGNAQKIIGMAEE